MIKNDVASDKFMQDLYAAYAVEDLTKFKQTCVRAVEQLSGNEGKKAGFINDLNRLNSKDRIISKVTNFVLAGQGLKTL